MVLFKTAAYLKMIKNCHWKIENYDLCNLVLRLWTPFFLASHVFVQSFSGGDLYTLLHRHVLPQPFQALHKLEANQTHSRLCWLWRQVTLATQCMKRKAPLPSIPSIPSRKDYIESICTSYVYIYILIYIYIYVYVYICMYICIYIYRERERYYIII